MKKIPVILGIVLLSLSCLGCRSEHRVSCDESLDSLLHDYYRLESGNLDSTIFKNGYLPFAYLEITGYTLYEVIEKWGAPTRYWIWNDVEILSYDDADYFSVAYPVLKALHKTEPLDIYEIRWRPYEDKNLYVTVYFIENCGKLIAIAGERLNSAVHLMVE